MAFKALPHRGFSVKILSIFLCLLTYSVKGQYVSIPDTGFLNWLTTNGYSQCIDSNQLDTTCAAVLNSTYINISYTYVNNLEGIQYFKSLDSLRCNADTTLTTVPEWPPHLKLLECRNNYLTSIPPLPDSLFWLACESNLLTSLPPLPSTLQYLTCYNNLLTTLPPLPSGIQLLYCSGNQIDSLPPLPGALTILSCFSNKLTTLPALPNTLQVLLCADNLLQALPALPASLTDLDCNTNSLTALPTLPDSLNYLGCYHNQLTGLPALPAALTALNCEYNKLTSLPDLPDSMYQLFCDNNPTLHCLPVLNTIFDLEFYTTGIDCVPDYGNVYVSEPALTSLPLCDSSNNTYGCLVVSGIKEVETPSMIIYPNPAKDLINLVFQAPTNEEMEFDLLDVLGQTIMKQTLNTGQTMSQYSTANLNSAMYYWRLQDSQRTIKTGKVVIMK